MTYFHSGSLDSVRAPHTRIPRPGNRRMALTPLGFSTSCAPVVTSYSRSMAPATTSLAGAFHTPVVLSVRA